MDHHRIYDRSGPHDPPDPPVLLLRTFGAGKRDLRDTRQAPPLAGQAQVGLLNQEED